MVGERRPPDEAAGYRESDLRYGTEMWCTFIWPAHTHTHTADTHRPLNTSFFIHPETCAAQADHQRKEFHHRRGSKPAGDSDQEQQGDRAEAEHEQAARFPAAAASEGAGEELQQAEGRGQVHSVSRLNDRLKLEEVSLLWLADRQLQGYTGQSRLRRGVRQVQHLQNEERGGGKHSEVSSPLRRSAVRAALWFTSSAGLQTGGRLHPQHHPGGATESADAELHQRGGQSGSDGPLPQ